MTITLEPMLALLNLSGGEIILILLVLLISTVVVVAIIGGIVFLLRARKKPPIPATAEPATQIIRKCPKCGADLKADLPEGLCPACLLQHGIATEGGAPPGTPSFTPPPLAELAKLFPQLEILEVIGQGGMGAVYKARQPSLDRFVALKILAPRSGGDLDFSGRFSREARALARLSHPNIVGVYDFGQIQRDASAGSAASTLSYFIMEFVDGPNLRQIEQAGRLTPREALQIIPQICAALQFAHDEGIVHRDIKPENVLLDKKGRVKIADFGLAKILGQEADFRLTGARDVMGTPHYMAPEQVEKPQEVDHRADIYSLGVVFYEMLTGDLPLGKFDPPSHKVQIDVRLDDIVLRSLANNPDRRYQQVSQFKTEIETVTTTPPQPAGAPSQAALMAAYAPGWEYKSKRTVFGLPLLHVSGGINPATGKVNVSRGIFAFGQIAQGIYASGGQAFGVVAFGGIAAGFVAIGGIGVGVIAFGGLALALLAIGGTALGIAGVGGVPDLIVNPLRDYHRIGALVMLSLVPLFGATITHFLVQFWARKRAGMQSLPPGQRPPGESQNKTIPLSRAQSVVLTVINIILAVLLLGAGWVAFRLNVFFNTVFFFIVLMTPIRIAILLWRGFRDGLEYGLWKKPLAAEFSKQRWQIANRWIFWLLCVAILEICMVPAQFSAVTYAVMHTLYLGGAIVLLLLELLPGRRLRLPTNIAIAIGSIFMAAQIARIYAPQEEANSVVLSMPVRGKWLILHGGRSSLINSHYFASELRNAVDIEKLLRGHERINPRDKLDSYPSWGQTVYAPADGTIAVVENDLDDHEVGKNDYENMLGNHICLDIGGNRFVLMANLEKGSILVSTDEVVHAGQPLAKIGNSGSSDHPHLHIQVQNAPRIFVTGQPDAKTFPIRFRDATLLRGKNKFAGAPFFVRRNDWIVSDAKEDEVAASETTNALAFAETWSPDLAPGEKPDLEKILEDAKYLMTRGHFEESLGRYIWFYNHEPEYGDSYQNVVRITSAISAWVELSRRYPKAKEALIEIRDRETRDFAQGKGYLELFQTVQAINRELQNEEATDALYQAILKGDPQLAGQCYFWMEAPLLARGDYELCYGHMGDAQSRFSSAVQMFRMDLARQKQSAERYRPPGQTNTPPFYYTDASAMIGRDATNRFVGAVGGLVEILIGTGHQTEAESLRDQALQVLDDPRVASVITDAEARVQQKRKSNLEKPAPPTNSFPANFTVPPPAKVAAGITNGSAALAETWAPTLQPGEKPDLQKIMEDAKNLMEQRQFEKSLGRYLWFYFHEPEYNDPYQNAIHGGSAFIEWMQLARRYPKAMQALVEIRNRDERKLSAGQGSFDMFMELKSINSQLEDENATYTLFKEIAAEDPKSAKQYYGAVESLLAQRGDYQSCLKYMGDPETRFKGFQHQWQTLKISEQHSEEMQRKIREHIRTTQPANGISAWAPVYEPPAPSKFADQNFITQTRQLIEILVGTGHQDEAEKIRDEAVALLDDAQIKSAVADAERKVKNAKP